MRNPRLRRLALPVLVALLGVLAATTALRAVGASLVPALRGGSASERLAPLLGLAPALVALLGARFLWTRSARDRSARRVLWGAATITLAFTYLATVRASAETDFHGLLTPEPNSSFRESYARRPRVLYEFNSHGFRRPEWPIAKPPGTFRIALVGDSFVFGSGVEQEHTLAAELTAQAAARFPGRALEVLNLGIAGDNLTSHVKVVELAQTLLDADVTILCLTLPNDLSRWDGQDEHREPGRIGAFSVVSWALGVQSAIVLWDMHELARDYTPEGLALLGEQLDLLRAFRREHGERPLLVFVYQDIPEQVRAPIAALPGVKLLPSAERREEYFLPGDGHPTGLGNQVFAAVLAAALPTQ